MHEVSGAECFGLADVAGWLFRALKLGALPRQNRTPPVMVVPKLDADNGLHLYPVDLSVTPNRVFPTRCMAHDRDLLTKDCLESLTANHGVAGYDESCALHFLLFLFFLDFTH